jgi:hypothetical protein
MIETASFKILSPNINAYKFWLTLSYLNKLSTATGSVAEMIDA